MKHIFKKLHIGGSNHHDSSSSNRSNNETLPSPPSPLSTSTSTAASDHPRNHSPATPPSTTATAANSGVNLQSDYISSEEEFQVQLALAISASNSEFVDKDQIHDATFLTSGRNRIDSRREADHAAESLSRRYWDYNVLDYDEKVVDGFYDIYGLSVDPASQGKMPLLSDLQSNSGDPRFQVVLVNRALDPALEELDQVARCFALDCPASELSVLVQRLADLVTEHMGGPVRDANIMLSRWTEKATYLQTSLHTNILPIGSLNIGLSRHRALLFKVLADNVGIPCRLVKGSHYTGIEDDAVNIVELENERECLVDLMAAPGTLIPADILNIKDTPFSSYNPITLQIANDVVADLSRQDVKHKAGIGKSFIGNSIPSDRNSSSQKPESKPSSSGTSSGELPMRIGSSSDGNSKFVVPANQSNPTSSSAKGTTQYKGKQGNLVIGDSVKQNLNVVPYSQDNREDSKNLFADLNPFQLGSGKSMQNEPPDNKVNDVQRRVDNIASGPGRSPLPVMWKNRNTQNEVPRTKQYEAVVGPRNNHESKHYNSSSQASSSFAPSDKIHSEIPKVNVINTSSSSYPMSTSNKNGKPSDSAASLSTLSTSHDKRLLSDEKGSQTVKQDILGQLPAKNLQKEYINDWEIVQTDLVTDTTEHGKNVTSKHDHKKFTHDQLISPKVTSKHLRSSSSVVDAGPEIPWEDLVIGERIGLGSYGEVYHADWKGTEVAVKKFLDQDFSGDALEEFRSEVRIMRRLRHPNVVLFLGAVTRPPHLSIITEFLPRGSLYRIIHRPNCQIDENRRIQMALDVAKGMNCLHNSMPTVVHRDLKSPNLLVDDNWNVKVCDFGLSRLKHNTFLSSKSTAGTPEWMAPEVLRNEPSNEKCDVYSFGVILWELATLRIPWTGMNPMQVVGAVGFQNRRLEIPKEVDPMVARIILGCWQTEPNLRPSFAQLATALKPLQRLVVPSEQQSSQQSLEISVNSTP